MKKGLMILLMSLSLIIFAVSAGLACESIAPSKPEPKVHSLQEFLDSVYAYELKTGEFRIGVGSVLTESDNLIELTVEVESFRFDLYHFDKEAVFCIELFHGLGGTVENKDKTQAYQVYDFLVETSSEGLRITKDDLRQGKFNDLQNKL
ncbi:MAG: hypothetical protein Q8L57_03835, partial [bacterium]|nr:hypothetical protein [bacterium]